MKPKTDFSNIIRISNRKATKKPRRAKFTRSKGYEIPDWFLKITPSKGHGSGVTQQRAWRVVSEYVRKRDYLKGCVSCGVKFEHWQESQAGHFIPWSVCNGIFKYDLDNLSAQCSHCNAWGGGNAGHNFALSLYGRGIDIDELRKRNNYYHGHKIEVWELVDLVAKLAPHLVQ